MKGIKKYLVAVCVLALSGALLAGCSSQASSSAASASGSASASSASASASASAASTEELIKEIEAVPGLEDVKSVTIDMKGVISIDMAAMAAELSASAESASAESASAESASAESASAESASAESAASSESSVMEIPTNIVMKIDESQEPGKLYFSLDMMGIPFEMYITGDDVVLVMQGQAYSGTLQDLEALGMSQYSSVESVMSSTGAGSFDQYKDAIKSITKETIDGNTVYTVVVDTAKVAGQDAMQALAQSGISGGLEEFTLIYTVGADGNLASGAIEMSGTGFSFIQNIEMTDYDATTVPDAPEATMSLSDLTGAIGAAAGEAAASSEASQAAA